mgnify:CR=1 FL=1
MIGWKHISLLLSFVSVFSLSPAQHPFEGKFENKELDVRAVLNLYESSLPVPGLEIESCYGYVQGNINGMWVVLKVKELNGTRAVVRAVSERGSDAQDLLMETTAKGLSVRQVDGAYIKGVKNRKYVKLPKTFVLTRKDD